MRKWSGIGSNINVGAAPSMLVSGMLLSVWFLTSVCSTLVNKGLMDSFPFAVTLSAVHMASSGVVDLCIVYWRGLNVTHFRRDVFRACLPIALTIDFGKTLTYVSYGMVPASLTHTAKASSPVFAVIVSKLMFNQMPSMATGLSLLPITIGVTLSALTEINWVFLGFLAAVTAALANVLNSTFTKKALSTQTSASAPPVDPLILHMYTAFSAMLMLLPWALMVEMPAISGMATKQAATEAALATREFRVLHGGDPPVPLFDAPPGLLLPFLRVFPFRAMFLSLLLHYAQNISNIYYLRGVSVLTHQVAQALKRLLNIAGAVLYFGNRVSALNLVGMTLALIGFTMYSMSKEKINVATTPAAGRMDRRINSFSGGSSSSVNSPLSRLGGFASPRSNTANGKPFIMSPTTVLIESSNGSHSAPLLSSVSPDTSNNGPPSGAGGNRMFVSGGGSIDQGNGPGVVGSVGVGWQGLPRTDSVESFGVSASPEPSLHPTAHALAVAQMQSAINGAASPLATQATGNSYPRTYARQADRDLNN